MDWLKPGCYPEYPDARLLFGKLLVVISGEVADNPLEDFGSFPECFY